MKTVTHTFRIILTSWILLLAGAAKGHVVQQLFFSLEKAGTDWQIVATFDAGYGLPEFRNDKDAPQPRRDWLYQLSDKEHARLKKEAEAYLRESLRFSHNNTLAPYRVSFPDYLKSPPDFPTLLNGGAYITIVMEGHIPQGDAGVFQAHVGEKPRPDIVIASGTENDRQYHLITPGNSASLFTTQADSSEVTIHQSKLLDILWMGYRHVIPDGLDHLLFILGLFLMARRWRPLLEQSLAFTFAHSITLGLASSGAVNLSQWSGAWLIEPLIALSISVVALENLWTRSNQPASRHRILVVFLFGLIHGLGFAGSLGTALDQANLHNLTALAIANLGVELAQITVLAIAWILTIRWWKSDHYQKFRFASSLIIASIGLFWFVDRLIN